MVYTLHTYALAIIGCLVVVIALTIVVDREENKKQQQYQSTIFEANEYAAQQKVKSNEIHQCVCCTHSSYIYSAIIWKTILVQLLVECWQSSIHALYNVSMNKMNECLNEREKGQVRLAIDMAASSTHCHCCCCYPIVTF